MGRMSAEVPDSCVVLFIKGNMEQVAATSRYRPGHTNNCTITSRFIAFEKSFHLQAPFVVCGPCFANSPVPPCARDQYGTAGATRVSHN